MSQQQLIDPAALRSITLGLAAVETVFWFAAIVASAAIRSSDPSGGIGAVIAIAATFGFFVLTLPAGLLAWYWRYLPAAALLAAAAGVSNTALLLIWVL